MKKKIEDWIKQICYEPFTKENIVALYFGLFETEDGYCLYLVGSSDYDENDDDWACAIEYEPFNKYLVLKGIKTDWQFILDNVYNILSDAIRKPEICDTPLFKGKTIAVGFDDGPMRLIESGNHGDF